MDEFTIGGEAFGSIHIPSSTGNLNLSISDSNLFYSGYGQREILSFEVKETTVEVGYRERSTTILAVNPPRHAPDRIWKEVYGIKDGRMTLLQVIQGKHIPYETLPERFEFNAE